jgi:isopentenyl-diphosphate delta-isomerase
MTTPSPTSLIDRVDADDRSIGRIPRERALAEGANFRTAHIFVFDHAERLLLQRLSATRRRNPGRWGSSVASYVRSGEAYEEAAQRRLREELGLRTALRFVGKMPMQDEHSTKFVGLYTCISESAEICEPDHIAELRYWSRADLVEHISRSHDSFTSTFLELYSFYSDETAEGRRRRRR